MSNLDRGLTVYLPAPLLRICGAAVPILVACYFLSGLQDKPLAPDEASPEVVAARLQPVAQVAGPGGKGVISSNGIGAPVKMLAFPGSGGGSVMSQTVAFASE